MPRIKPRDLRPVVTYERDAVLDPGHLVAALGVSEEIIAKMDLPCFAAGERVKYLWGQVVDELARRADPTGEARKAS